MNSVFFAMLHNRFYFGVQYEQERYQIMKRFHSFFDVKKNRRNFTIYLEYYILWGFSTQPSGSKLIHSNNTFRISVIWKLWTLCIQFLSLTEPNRLYHVWMF